MTPANDLWETFVSILFPAVARLIALAYLVGWDRDVRRYLKDQTRVDGGADAKGKRD